MPRTRIAWLLGLLCAVSLIWALRGMREPERALPGDEAALASSSVRASASSADDQAALAFDGRRDGTLPYAWRPGRPGGAELALDLTSRAPLAGAVVSWSGALPQDARLRVGESWLSVPEARVDAESVLWFARPQTASRVVLALTAAADTGVAELTLLPAKPAAVLVSPRARADWDQELLATYGFTGTARVPPTADLSPMLARARIVAVSNAELTDSALAALRAYVRDGGTLVELGPRPAVCGPSRRGDEPAGAGFVLSGASGAGVRWFAPIARLSPCAGPECGDQRVEITAASPGASDELPLVVSRALGRGTCTRWLGDLAAAVRGLRQGDPELGRSEAASAGARKPADLFARRVDALDFDVPSADRLGFALAAQLARAPGFDVLVGTLPSAAPALVVLTADQDFVPGPGVIAHSDATQNAGITFTLTASDIGGAPDILYPGTHPPMLEPEEVKALAARGHDVGIHPNLVGVEPAGYARVIAAHAARFRERFGAPPRIVRNHHLIWSGYLDMAELHAREGLRMNLDYVSADRSGRMPAGFMTGSGLAMRFCDERGRLLPLRQQATHIDDSAFITAGEAQRESITAALVARARALLDIARREHVPIGVLHHPHWWYHTGGSFQSALLARARELSIPVWGAAAWLRFVEDRAATELTRDGAAVIANVRGDAVTLLIETIEGAEDIRVDGVRVKLATEIDLAGARFRLLPLPHGRHRIER